MDNRFRVGKTYISATNLSDAKKRIEDEASKKNGGYVCVSNLRMVRYACKCSSYRQVMKESMMNVPDGMPLVWCGHLWGCHNVGRTMGFELFKATLTNVSTNLNHYLLGDTQDVLDSITEKFKTEYNANIVGSYSLPFAEVDEFDYPAIAKMLIDSNANIVWTAMRSPKQDEFNKKLTQYAPNVVCIGVGRAFRLSIGQFNEVPDIAKKLGLSGIWLRKTSLLNTLWWYFQSCFYLAYYLLQILILRLIKSKAND